MDNLVSIILTSHNRPDYLKQAINSILNQTIPNIELIIIDDYSTDKNVIKVINAAQEKDTRIKAFKTNHNVNNLSVLWNIGIDNSEGKYIALLDDDNKKFPEFCQEMSSFLENHIEYDAVACYAQIIQYDKELSIFDRAKDMTNYNIRQDNYVDSGCMMFRRNIIDKIGWFDERLTTSEDWDFVKRIQLQTKGFGIIHKPLTYYRWHGDNRMYKRVALGDIANAATIKYKKNYDKKINVLLFSEDLYTLTLSQRDVILGIKAALNRIEFVNANYCDVSNINNISQIYDIILIVAPFSIDTKYIQRLAKYGQERVHFHIEDPQAIDINFDKLRYATYIFSNDNSTLQQYKDALYYRAGFCPSISYDDINLKLRENITQKGIIFYGYGYESRRTFVSLLKPQLKQAGYDIRIIGGGWNGMEDIGELSQQKSIDLFQESEIIILQNRKVTDLGGQKTNLNPESIVRGYFEAASGTLVMIDSDRKHNCPNWLVTYDDIPDLIQKIDYYMKNKDIRGNLAKLAQNEVLNNYTYEKRIRKMLNIVRSQRFNAKIS